MIGKNEKKFSDWMKLQNAGLWFGVFYLAVSALWFALSFQYRYYSDFGPGAGMYPRWLSGISILVACVYIWNARTKQARPFGEAFPGGKELLNVATIFAACIAFILLLDLVGFNITGTLFLCMALFKHYKWWQVILTSVLVTVILFVLFKYCFSVPLPVTALGF